MIIGLFHNFYRERTPSGENGAVGEISKMLEDLDFDVRQFYSHTDIILKNLKTKVVVGNNLLMPLIIQKNQEIYKQINEIETVQIHNSFPGVNTSILKHINNLNIPVTQVIHNYRLTCLNGMHFRNNENCYDCLGANFNAGIRNSCYGNSKILSAAKAHHTSTLKKNLSSLEAKYIAVSNNVRDYLIEINIPSNLITVITNSVIALPTINADSNEILFVGRLEKEKGIESLLKLHKLDKTLPKIHIIGSGPLEEFVRQEEVLNSKLIYHGQLSKNEISQVALKCKVAVMPNKWKEPFGKTLIEACSRGQAIVATDSGIAKHVITPGVNGYLCEYSEESILESVKKALQLNFQVHSIESKRIWKEEYSIEAVQEQWKKYYAEY